MYPTTLRPLLANPAFAPNDILAAEADCDQWFRATAEVAPFVMRSIFRQLIDEGWTQQAVPNADWQDFLNDVLPRMVAVLDALPADPGAEVRALVIGYHSTI